MKKYSDIVIVVSFFGLWMDSYFSADLQLFTGFLLIFTFGILHGANDLLLIENIKSKKDSRYSFTMLRYYVLVVLLGGFLFYIMPWFALLSFIIVSSYHFGEQQWHNLQNDFPKWLSIMFQFLYGFFILLLLFDFHSSEVQNIILNISDINIPGHYFTVLLQVSGITFLALGVFIYWKSFKIRKKLLIEIFHLILYGIIFKSASLIWGFAIYFVFWHSIPSMIDQVKFLYGTFSLNYFIAYCHTAAVYWFISIMGITILYFVCSKDQLFNALFFSFLAAITFPHALVITKMFRAKKQD